MEKVFEEIRSLVRRERYQPIDQWNVYLRCHSQFHDPLMKNNKSSLVPDIHISFSFIASRRLDNSITGWNYVSINSRVEKKLLKNIIITTGNFCTCRAFFYRKQSNYKCKHIIDFETKKETKAIVERFLGEKGLATHIQDFLGEWENPPHCTCEKPQCTRKAVWKMENGDKVCNKCLPKVSVHLMICEHSWCTSPSKFIMPCGKKICGRHIPKVQAQKI